MATKKQEDPAIYVAIALALYEYSGASQHDGDNMRLTIKRQAVPSAWAAKSLLMRQKVDREF